MSRLYELSDKYNALSGLLENAEAEEAQVLEALNNIKDQFNVKAENIGKLILSLAGDIAVTQKEEERLAARRRGIERQFNYMKSYLRQEMVATKNERIEGEVLTISLRKNPDSVNIVDQDAILEEFRTIIPETWQPNKTLILNHFKNTGEIISGVEIIRDKKTLTIK